MNIVFKRTWQLAIVTFVVVDLATTFVGISEPALIEANPLADEMYNDGNIVGLLMFKLAPTVILYYADKVIFEKVKIALLGGLLSAIGIRTLIVNSANLDIVGYNGIGIAILSIASGVVIAEKWGKYVDS